MRKNSKGITLSILVVTIVVLLIIIGVSFLSVADNEILIKTENTINTYNNKINTTYQYEENAVKQNVVDFQVKN